MWQMWKTLNTTNTISTTIASAYTDAAATTIITKVIGNTATNNTAIADSNTAIISTTTAFTTSSRSTFISARPTTIILILLTLSTEKHFAENYMKSGESRL